MDCFMDGMDDATLQLILQIQRADVEELRGQAENLEHKNGVPQDAGFAVELYQQELSSLETFAADRALCQRMTEEDEAGEAQEEAGDEPGQTEPRPEDTVTAAALGKCNMCLDEHLQTDLFLTTCRHNYCRGCLIDLFEASTTDESLFPPRCCGNAFPVAEHEHVLGEDLVSRWREKEVEYTTPNRTYCHVKNCSTFIPPRHIEGDVGICPLDCKQRTCTLCKGPEHPNHVCEQDDATQEVLRIATENNWQRCSGCQAVIELDRGCYHITCRCRNEFCYVCLARWKTCTCPTWDEARLLAAGEQQVARDERGQNLNVAQRRAAVERAREEIRENHECDHGRWRSINRRQSCDGCGQVMPEYIYQCQQCRIFACRRCRHNRF